LIILIDHRQELTHWLLDIHSSAINQTQYPLNVIDADPAILAQNGPTVHLHQFIPVGFYQLPPFPHASLVAAMLLLEIKGELPLHLLNNSTIGNRLSFLDLAEPLFQMVRAGLPRCL
jgi:hypothetical protein